MEVVEILQVIDGEPSVNLASHLKAGFTNRWNLLIFFAAAAFALISGRADVALPLVLAAEVAYLGLVARRESDRDPPPDSLRDLSHREFVQRIRDAIPASDFQRYEKLQRRCEDLRDITSTLRETDNSDGKKPTQHPPSRLGRLLISFLRLLYTRQLLNNFMASTDARLIQQDIERFEAKLAELGDAGGPPHRKKLRRSVQENLDTSRLRLDNYKKIESNLELIALEIDGLENKIQSLAESGIADREPEKIAEQVESVTASVKETEQTISRIDFDVPLDPKALDLLGPISFEDDSGAEDEQYFDFEDDD